MKAITLFQPWAECVARGWKHWETRSWSTSYRGTIAIHAGRRLATKKERAPVLDCQPWKFLRDAGDIRRYDELPHACVVAIARVEAVLPTNQARDVITADRAADAARELLLGDYGPGRLAWKLDEVRSLMHPVPMLGQRGIWTVPEELEASIMRQVFSARPTDELHERIAP